MGFKKPQTTRKIESLPPDRLSLHEVEKKLGMNGKRVGSSTILKSGSADIFIFQQKMAWFVWSGASDKSGAERYGKKIRKNLIARTKMGPSSPMVHGWDMYVGYEGGYIKMGKNREMEGYDMNREAVARELVKVAKSLMGGDLYEMGEIVSILKKNNRNREVKISGNDDNLSITIKKMTNRGNEIYAFYSVVESSDGASFDVKGAETVSKDGNVLYHEKVRDRIKSAEKGSYVPKMTGRQLKNFEEKYIKEWIDSDW
jgi:hypothetical protein